MMDLFLDCLCDNRLEALIRSGTATEFELQEAWMVILTDFQDMKGEMEVSEQFQLIIDVNRLRAHLWLLDRCIQLLQVQYSEVAAKGVKRLGYSFNPVEKTPEAYFELLQAMENNSKTKYIELKQLIATLNKLNEKMEQVKPDRESFEVFVLHIEEMQGAVYNLETLSVSKYISLEKKYWRKVELIKQKAAWQKR